MSNSSHGNTGASRTPRIYLAGPEVFLLEAVSLGEHKKRLCAQYGFEGVYPADVDADMAGMSPREAALRIGRMNEDAIRGCDAVIANITPFRGPSADVGTAYEMGFARSLGLVVCAYTNISASFASRTIGFIGDHVSKATDGRIRDAHGMAIEEWGLADNLMLESCIANSGGCLIVHDASAADLFTCLEGFEQCLRVLTRDRLLPYLRR